VSPFGIFLFRQFFKSIPDDIVHAARLDGLAEGAIVWRIMVPMAVPAVVVFSIYSVVAHWNDLFWPLLVMRQQTSYTLSQALYYLQGAYGTNYHLKLAAATLVVLPPIVVYLVAQKQIMRGVALTGVKG